MASNGAIDLKTKLDILERFTKPVASGETIPTGSWVTLNASDEMVAVTTKTALAWMAWSGTDQTSSRNVQSDPIFGDTATTEISTGGVTGLVGKYRASLDDTGYDTGGTYAQGTALTVENGKLTNAGASDPVIAYQLLPIGTDNRLHFITV